jgi:hypothetical protein
VRSKRESLCRIAGNRTISSSAAASRGAGGAESIGVSLSRRRVYHSDISLADASAAPVGLKPASSQPRTALLDRLTSRLARLGCRANGNKRPAGSTASAVLANRRGTAARSRSSASDGLDDLRGSRAEGGELGEGSVLTEGYPHHRPTSKVPARRCFL